MASILNSVSRFTSIEIFIILSDIISYVFQNIYKTIKKYILDPIIDPYFPKEKLDNMKYNLPIFNKSQIHYGNLFVDMIKHIVLILLTYQIYRLVKKYKGKKI